MTLEEWLVASLSYHRSLIPRVPVAGEVSRVWLPWAHAARSSESAMVVAVLVVQATVLRYRSYYKATVYWRHTVEHGHNGGWIFYPPTPFAFYFKIFHSKSFISWIWILLREGVELHGLSASRVDWLVVLISYHFNELCKLELLNMWN